MNPFEQITQEHLGSDATEATIDQFRRACEAAISQHPGIWNWDEDGVLEEEGVVDYVWNNGSFGVRIRELLGEDIDV